jgi:hypothetical protein
MFRATFVGMRNVFVDAGRAASLGRYAFGFAWGSWAALLISTILFFLARRKREPTVAATSTGRTRRTWWPWRRSATRRSSRVKGDYA